MNETPEKDEINVPTFDETHAAHYSHKQYVTNVAQRLRHYYDLSIEQAAEVLGMYPDTLANWLGESGYENSKQDVVEVYPNTHNRYWEQFENYCSERVNLEPLPPEFNKKNNYYGFYIRGVSNKVGWLAAWRRTDSRKIAAILQLNQQVMQTPLRSERLRPVDALTVFRELERQQNAIEHKFGDTLTWLERPPYKSRGPVVGVWMDVRSIDETDWLNQIMWMSNNLVKLHEAIHPYLLDIIGVGKRHSHLP